MWNNLVYMGNCFYITPNGRLNEKIICKNHKHPNHSLVYGVIHLYALCINKYITIISLLSPCATTNKLWQRPRNRLDKQKLKNTDVY